MLSSSQHAVKVRIRAYVDLMVRNQLRVALLNLIVFLIARGGLLPHAQYIGIRLKLNLTNQHMHRRGQNLRGPYGHESGLRAGLLILVVIVFLIARGGIPPTLSTLVFLKLNLTNQNMHRRGSEGGQMRDQHISYSKTSVRAWHLAL